MHGSVLDKVETYRAPALVPEKMGLAGFLDEALKMP